MKITRPDGTKIEFDDNAPSQSATEAPEPEKPAGFPLKESAPQPQGDTTTKVDTVADTPTPGPVPTPSAPVKFTEAPPASSLSAGTLYGGEPNISDPQKSNPKVFNFVPPREE